MVKEYNVVIKNGLPTLNIVRKINIDNNNISIEELVKLLNTYYQYNKLSFEQSMMACYDNQSNLIGLFKISIGNHSSCSMYRNIIATDLLLCGARQFVVIHNHTNGNPLTPSEEDIKNHNTIQQLSVLLDINYVDSIIINKDGWYMIGEKEIFYD